MFNGRLGTTNLTTHSLETGDAKPIALPLYKQSYYQEAEIRKAVNDMLAQGVIRVSNSPWSAPIVLAKKKDGTNRFCTDYRRLNMVTKSDATPLPLVSSTLNQLGRSCYFTTLDLLAGYWQIALSPDSIPKTAFSTADGHYEYLRMPFGLKTAPATFQKCMNLLYSSMLYRNLVVYLDDLLIYSETWEDHVKHLDEVLQKLESARLKAKISKCHFALPEVEYVGHLVSAKGIQPTPRLIQSVANIPTPANVKQVRAFLGLCSYYRRFIRDFANIAQPINLLLHNDVVFNWTPQCQSSFESLKSALTCYPIVRVPDFTKQFIVYADASTHALGAILSQVFEDGNEHVIAYSSRTLNSQEQRYGITELECLGVVYAIKQFTQFIYGSHFLVVTDHAALVWLHTMRNYNSKLMRWALQLQPYSFSILHKSGATHKNVDGLSRVYEPDSLPQPNLFNEAISTMSSTEIQTYMDNVLHLVDSVPSVSSLPSSSISIGSVGMVLSTPALTIPISSTLPSHLNSPSLEVLCSKILGSGFGVFALKSFSPARNTSLGKTKADTICQYECDYLFSPDGTDPFPEDEHYKVRVGKHHWFSALSVYNIGRHINTCRANDKLKYGLRGNNCALSPNLRSNPPTLSVKATRRICVGDELFLSYGPCHRIHNDNTYIDSSPCTPIPPTIPLVQSTSPMSSPHDVLHSRHGTSPPPLCPILPPYTKRRLVSVRPLPSSNPTSSNDLFIFSINMVNQINESDELTNSIEDETFYEVEKLVNHRGTGVNIKYLVKWKGYPHNQNTWQSINDLVLAPEALINYNTEHNITVPLPFPTTTDRNDNIIDLDELAQQAEDSHDNYNDELESKYDPEYTPYPRSSLTPDMYELIPPTVTVDTDDGDVTPSFPSPPSCDGSVDDVAPPAGCFVPLTDATLLQSLVLAQQADPILACIYSWVVNNVPLPPSFPLKGRIKKDFFVYEQELLYYLPQVGPLTKRVYMPQSLVSTILSLHHDHILAGHQGSDRVFASVSGLYYWIGMRRDIITYVQSCVICQRRRAAVASRLPVLTFPVSEAMQRVSMDLVGPLPLSRHGYQHILVINEYLTRWVELYPLKDQRAVSIANCIVDYVCRYSAPQHLLTDRGKNFIGLVMTHVYKVLGIKKINTTSYHPQTDGLTERTNRTLQAVLSSYIEQHQSTWPEVLPMTKYVLNTHINKTTGISPFFAMFGRHPRLSLDHVYYQSHLSSIPPNDETSYAGEVYKRINDIHAHAARSLSAVSYPDLHSSRRTVTYSVGDYVWLRVHKILPGASRKLSMRFTGPYAIVSKPFPNVLMIMTKQGERRVNISRCKPVYLRVTSATPELALGQLLRYQTLTSGASSIPPVSLLLEPVPMDEHCPTLPSPPSPLTTVNTQPPLPTTRSRS